MTLMSRDLVSSHVDFAKQRVVVQHLFKVRNQPFRVDAVPGKTATDVIPNASGCHAIQRQFGGSDQPAVVA